MDALNTQKDVAREIKEADAEYVLARRGNHPPLHQEVSDFLLDAQRRNFAGVAPDCYAEADKGQGRLEIRRHWITARIGWITARAEWEGRRGVGLVERERHPAAGGSVGRACYLCSIAPDARLSARAVRGHRGVENSRHWRLGRDLPGRSVPRTHALCRGQPSGATQAGPQRRQGGWERQGRYQGQALPRRHQR